MHLRMMVTIPLFSEATGNIHISMYELAYGSAVRTTRITNLGGLDVVGCR